MGLVYLHPGQRPAERIIGRLIPETGHHGGDLGIENRVGHGAEFQQKDFHILPGGVEDLHDMWLRHQFAERAKIKPRRQGIHQRNLMLAGQLDQAELWPIGAFTHEFRVHGDEGLMLQPVAKRGEASGIGDQGGALFGCRGGMAAVHNRFHTGAQGPGKAVGLTETPPWGAFPRLSAT